MSQELSTFLPSHNSPKSNMLSQTCESQPESSQVLAGEIQFSKLNNPLHHFVKSNTHNKEDINAVFSWMSDDMAVNDLDDEGLSALHRAVLNENVFMVEKLLSCIQNLDVNTKCSESVRLLGGSTALHFSVILYHLPIFQLLLDNGADVNAVDKNGTSVLHYAIECGNLEKNETTVKFAADSNEIGSIYPLLEESEQHPLDHLAAQSINMDIIKLLLDRGANVNVQNHKGNTALHFAVNFNNMNKVNLLLEKNADVNDVNSFSETPFHFAVKASFIDIIRLLIDKVADINAKVFCHRTALYYAVRSNNIDIIKLLLDKGADVNDVPRYGSAALHYAAEKGLVNVVKLLLDYGADVNLKIHQNMTPLSYALSSANQEIVDLLLDKDADF